MFRDVFCSLPAFQPIPCSQMTYKDLISRVDFWDNNSISRRSDSTINMWLKVDP